MENLIITFYAENGNFIIDDVELFWHIQDSLLYDVDYTPEFLEKAIRKLNEKLK